MLDSSQRAREKEEGVVECELNALQFVWEAKHVCHVCV